jgi:hypothetical protein
LSVVRFTAMHSASDLDDAVAEAIGHEDPPVTDSEPPNVATSFESLHVSGFRVRVALDGRNHS